MQVLIMFAFFVIYSQGYYCYQYIISTILYISILNM